MKRNRDINEEQEHQNKKQKVSENSPFQEEETSLLLSMVDMNILQNIFIQLIDQYEYCIYEDEEELKTALTLLLNFSLSCKLFFKISKQPLFPLKLNNININLNYKKYLKILFIQQLVEKQKYYKEKNINNIFFESCYLGFYDLINTLIKYGANINQPQGEFEFTPLITASCSPNRIANVKTVKKLIKFKNLNINQQNTGKKSALISMFCYSDYEYEDKEDKNLKFKEETIKILLSRKDIDINIADGDGKKALDYAKESKYEDIVKILENHQN